MTLQSAYFHISHIFHIPHIPHIPHISHISTLILNMSIEVKNLLKIYGEQKAVNNISFKVNKGEIVGFLGPNGAGKSTTMKIITGYLPQSGANALYYDMYVKEWLAFVAEVHQLKDQRSKIKNVIDTVGLGVEANKKIGQLSKGYKQRVGLAAALIHDPEVLILDEPTSGLDPNQIVEIRDVIKNQGQNKTVLFSSHILQEVEAICDRIIIINKGNIVADDTLSNLQKNKNEKHSVRVEFKETVHEAYLKELKTVYAISNSPSLDDAVGQGSKIFNIQCSDAESVKKQLLQLAIEKNLNIVSLQSEDQSLEEVFKALTN